MEAIITEVAQRQRQYDHFSPWVHVQLSDTLTVYIEADRIQRATDLPYKNERMKRTQDRSHSKHLLLVN